MSHNSCPKCKSLATYSEKYDAFLCVSCNAWLERVCEDTECKYCRLRPDDPRSAYLGKVKTYAEVNALYSLEHFRSRVVGGSIAVEDGHTSSIFVDGIHIPELYLVGWSATPEDSIARKFAKGVSIDDIDKLYPNKTIQIEWCPQ